MPAHVVIGAFVLVVGTSTPLFWRAAGTLSPAKPNLISWIFYFDLVLQTAVGVLLFALGVDHYMISRASEDAVTATYLAVAYTLLVMPLAMIATQELILNGRIRERVLAFFAEPLRPFQSFRDTSQVLFWGTVTLVCMSATIYTYSVIERAPLVAALQGASVGEIARLRIDAKMGFAGNVYVRNLLSLLLAPIVSYVAYAYYRLRGGWLSAVWFVGSVLLAVAAVTYSGEKAPIMEYLFGLVFVRAMINGGIKRSEIVAFGLVAVGMVAALYAITADQFGIALNTGPVGRILMGQDAGLFLAFDTFPDEHGFLLGRSLPAWLVGLFGAEQVDAARLVMRTFNPSGIEAGQAGVMNSLFVAQAWGNFGLPGVLLSPVVAGTVIQVLHDMFMRLPKTPAVVAVIGYAIVSIPVTGGFIGIIWNPTLLVVGVVVLFSLLARPLLTGAAGRGPRRPPSGAETTA